VQDEGEMRREMREMFQRKSIFDLQRVNIVSNTKTQDYHELPSIEVFRAHGAILWFITNDVGRCTFRVNIYFRDPEHDLLGLLKECISYNGETGGRRLHIFMWTHYSKLFKDRNFKGRPEFFVGCSCDANASELEKVVVEKGWLLMFDYNEIIRKFVTKSS
jgi:hypothetical protein